VSRNEKRIVLALSVVIALTRLLAPAASLFDWDEALFTMGVRDYDVAHHQPHPPGYPLFIAAAKGVHLLGVEEFRSLQAIVFLGAVFLFPALFFFAREAGFDFTTAVCGAAIFSFFPNVLLYGGTGFSDVPATTLVFVACALLLRGRTDARAYVAGAIVLGIAAGFRTPNLIIGAAPALLATWHRIRARSYASVAIAILAGGIIVAASYGGAALASESVAGYLDAVEAQRKWVREVDSWRNPIRGSLRGAAVLFFVQPFQHEDLMRTLAVFVAISVIAGLVRRRAAVPIVLATFAPLAGIAWLNFDVNTASRYAIAYMALHALLAADGFLLLGRHRAVQLFLAAATVAVSLGWSWPALRLQRTTPAPPVAALRWVAENVPVSERVFVHRSYYPHADAILPRHNVTLFDNDALVKDITGDWIVDWRTYAEGHNFTYPRTNPLWKVVRQRAFEASVRPVPVLRK